MNSAIVYHQRYAFDPQPHLGLISQKLQREVTELNALRNRFKAVHYTTTQNYSFDLGFGARENSHVDMRVYQALLVVKPNGWVVKSPRNSSRAVFQDAGDLVVLNTGVQHEVCWERGRPKPTEPWIYLFIDINRRAKWAVSELQAVEMAQEAVNEITAIEHIEWLTAGVKV